MTSDLLDRLLERALGYVLSPWPTAVASAVRALASERGVSEQDLLVRLSSRPDAPALRRLIAASTIPHTAFFRHPDQFQQLARGGLAHLAAAHPGRPVRIWSAGCATGRRRTPRAHRRARAHRGGDPRDRRERTGDRARAGRSLRAPAAAARCDRGAARRVGRRPWTAPQSIARTIRFEVASLVDPSPSCGWRDIDLVVCRNVLIYFSPDSARALLSSLARTLRAGGAVMLSPAEHALRVVQGRATSGTFGWLERESILRGVPTATPITMTRRSPAQASVVATRAERARDARADGREPDRRRDRGGGAAARVGRRRRRGVDAARAARSRADARGGVVPPRGGAPREGRSRTGAHVVRGGGAPRAAPLPARRSGDARGGGAQARGQCVGSIGAVDRAISRVSHDALDRQTGRGHGPARAPAGRSGGRRGGRRRTDADRRERRGGRGAGPGRARGGRRGRGGDPGRERAHRRGRR